MAGRPAVGRLDCRRGRGAAAGAARGRGRRPGTAEVHPGRRRLGRARRDGRSGHPVVHRPDAAVAAGGRLVRVRDGRRRSTTRPTPPGSPHWCRSPTCWPSTVSRGWSGRRSARRSGPAWPASLVGAFSPGAALGVAALSALHRAGGADHRAADAVRRDPIGEETAAHEAAHPVRTALADMREGFVYMVRTPWLLATLLFASLLVLAIMGPFEVLIPFLIKDKLGGGASDYAHGDGCLRDRRRARALAMASMPMPRRYLTFMMLMWGVGSPAPRGDGRGDRGLADRRRHLRAGLSRSRHRWSSGGRCCSAGCRRT